MMGGNLPPLRVLSMNLAGVKSGTRLRQALAAARRERGDVFLAQEHGLHAEDEERLQREADEFGFRIRSLIH